MAKKYGDDIISLEHNGLPLILEKSTETTIPTPSSVLLGIQSSNIQEDFKRLRDMGVTMIFTEPKSCPPGYYFVIEDYSGNQIEIVEFKEKE